MINPFEENKADQFTDRFSEIIAYIFVTLIMVGLTVKILFF